MGVKQEYEVFYGSKLIEDNHASRLNSPKMSGTDEFFKGHAKKLQEASLERPVIRDEEVVLMLCIAHPSMANRTKTVGATLFIFDRSGVAKVPMSALQEWLGLLRQPGYFDPVERARQAEVKVVPLKPPVVEAVKVAVQEVEEKVTEKAATTAMPQKASPRFKSKKSSTKKE